MATEIRQDTFDSFIAQPGKPVLVDFWATWCGPCRMLAPVVEQVSEENEGKLAVGKVNVDDCPDLAMKFGVMSIPTVLVFKNGEAVTGCVGVRPKADILALLA